MVKMSENAKLIMEAFNELGTCSAKQLATYICRTRDKIISPNSVAGTLRVAAQRGEAASSNCGNGTTMYWPVKYNF